MQSMGSQKVRDDSATEQKANSFMKQKIYNRELTNLKSDLLKRHLSEAFARHDG